MATNYKTESTHEIFETLRVELDLITKGIEMLFRHVQFKMPGLAYTLS